MATPHEMLERLEHAIAQPRWRRNALVLSVPGLLGEQGHAMRADDYGPRYGYTRRQCKRMRYLIASEIAINARNVTLAAESPAAEFYTGDFE